MLSSACWQPSNGHANSTSRMPIAILEERAANMSGLCLCTSIVVIRLSFVLDWSPKSLAKCKTRNSLLGVRHKIDSSSCTHRRAVISPVGRGAAFLPELVIIRAVARMVWLTNRTTVTLVHVFGCSTVSCMYKKTAFRKVFKAV